MFQRIRFLVIVFAFGLLFSYSGSSRAANQGGGDFMEQLAEDTWLYLSSDWATDNHLPWSWRSETAVGGDYANPTEIGLYMLSWLGAFEMGRDWSPDWTAVQTELIFVLDQLEGWQSGTEPEPNGVNVYNDSVFYQAYWINPPSVGAGSNDHVVPSIDNAFLAASLITIREYGEMNGHAALAQKADDILADMDFRLWYDETTAVFALGATENPLGGGPADYYSNENRIINFVARAMGQLTKEEYLNSLAALVQGPGTYNGITVDKVAWDGSYFTYTAPALFIREMDTYYGHTTITPATEAQIAYAGDEGYVAWGLSDAFDIVPNVYAHQGAPPADTPDPLEERAGLITPHASGLALITPYSDEAISNLQTISMTFPSFYEPARGFRDSVVALPGPDFGKMSDRFSALAQEWLFLSIVNAETGFIWNYFYKDAGVNQAHLEMFRVVVMPTVLRE